MAYYITERNMVRIWALSRNSWHRKVDNQQTTFAMKFVVQHNDGERYTLVVKDANYTIHDNRYEYDLPSLNANFSLIDSLNAQYNLNLAQNYSVIDNFRIKLFILDLTRNLSTKHSIDV